MNNFMFVYKKEVFKLLHKKKYYTLTILGLIISVMRFGGTALISKVTSGEIVIRSNLAMEMLPFVFELLLPLIILVAAADLFAHEYSEGTLKMSLLQPANRFKLLSAKAAAIMTLAVGIMLINYILTTVLGLLSGPVPVMTSFVAYLLDILPLIGITFIGILISTLVKGSATATLLSLGVYVLIKYLGIYVSYLGSILFTANAKLHMSILGVGLPIHMLIYKFAILFGSILILYSVSYIMFEKKNV